MKYFQYLSLLFTEIYLDCTSTSAKTCWMALNEEMARYRSESGAEPFRDFEVDDLNKVAFWNATGSGKTLLLHGQHPSVPPLLPGGRSDYYP